MNISKLNPESLWSYFYALTQIPRPSGAEQRVVEWIASLAAERAWECRVDEVGNVRLSVEASEGCEDRPRVVMQAHLDMVCEKRSDVEIDFLNQPIECYEEEGWVRARGTTLGADCGIGVAAALAILSSDDLQHGALDALFTVDEERGLTGAFSLGEGMIRGERLINLDSEDEGEIFIGCAGGIDSVAELAYSRDESQSGSVVRISVGGLQGGHSGDDIDKGRANSVKIVADIIYESGGRVVDLNAGNLRNAIPREGWVDLLFDREVDLQPLCDSMIERYIDREPNIAINVESVAAEARPISIESQERLIQALRGVVNGVIAMSQQIEGLVETSSNLASVRCEASLFKIVTSQRSSTIEGRDEAMTRVEESFREVCATVTHSDGYPGWSPNPDSELLGIAQRCHSELFGMEARVRAIHAGLECGLFLEHNSALDMISFGPTMRGVHSPDERVEVASVERFYKLLKQLIESV